VHLRKLLIAVFSITLFVSVLLEASAFKYCCRSLKYCKVLCNDSEAAFFSLNITGINFFVRVDKTGLPGLKILGISKSEARYPYTVKNASNEFVLAVGGTGINAYSKEGILISAYTVAGENRIVDICISDINSEKREKVLMLTGKKGCKYGEELIILDLKMDEGEQGLEFREIYRHPLKILRPWKVQTADVDGDKKVEISLGVYKTARFHPVMAKRPFVYNWDGSFMSPKWLGSRLARPFDDYIFTDIDSDGRDELVSIEQLENGSKAINSYSWKGFGFESIGQSKEYRDILQIGKGKAVSDDCFSIMAKVKTQRNIKDIEFVYKKGNLVEKKLRRVVMK